MLRCPVCGAGMYGNVNRKRKKDGGFYKEYYYYACKHRLEVDGHRCDYNRQWKQERVDDAVTEVIKKLVRNPKFEVAIREKIGSRIDTEELENELEGLRKRQRQLIGAKKKLGQQMDKLDITDPFYDQKYQDMDERLCKLYEDIASVERNMDEIQTRLDNIRQQKISSDNVYQFLLYFDLLYDKFTDSEKKEFLQSFVERVEVFPEEQPGGRFLKRIKFRFPVYFDGAEVESMRWDNETTVESVVTLSKGEIDCETVKVDFSLEEFDMASIVSDPTYPQIKEYVLEHTGLKISSLYIAQVKRKCGLEVGENHNLAAPGGRQQPQVPPEKEKAIRDALKYFAMI